MAAVNEASIRVTANTAPFQADMRKASRNVKREAGKMEDSLGDALKKGFGEGKKNAKALLGSVRDITSQILTLGGAVSGGMLVGNAVKAQQANIVLAAKLSRVRGELVGVAEAQKDIETATDRAGGSLEEMRDSANLLAGVSDLIGKDGFADALARSTLQAKRFGVEGDKVAEIWARTMRMLGEGADVDEVESNIERLAMTVETMGQNVADVFNPEDISEFISKTQRTNLEFEQALVLLEMMVGKGREFGEALEFAEEVGLALGTAGGLQNITEAANMSKDALNVNNTIAENFIAILAKGPKAVKAMAKEMQSDLAGAGFEEILGKDFVARALTGKGKFTDDELRDANAKIEDAFSRQAKATFDAVAIEEHNNAIRATAGAKFGSAMRELNKAFQSDKVTEAITKIADELPKIVEPIAALVATAAEDPWTTVATIVGARLALAVGGPMVTAAVTKGVTTLFSRAAAQAVATSAAAMAVQGAGAVGLGATAGAGGVAGAAALAAGAATVVLAAGAAAAFGLAVGTVISKLLGQEESIVEEFDALRAAQFATTTASGVGPGASAEKIKSALEDLKTSKVRLAESESNIFQQGLAGAASLVTGKKSPDEMREEASKKIEAESARLIEALSKIAGAADGAARGLENIKDKAGGTTRGTNHLPQVTGNTAVAG